jgi:nucleoside-triphosphatase
MTFELNGRRGRGRGRMGRTLLLTGRPGVGKTTVIKKVADALGDHVGGFYTEEIRSSTGRRQGFRLVTLDGNEAVMAHTDLRGERRPRVSRYGVDVEAIEDVGVAAIQRAVAADEVVIVDEVGKMELFCEAFKEAVTEAVESENPVLATVMRGSRPWVDELRAKEQVEVWEVTVENRDTLPEQVCRWVTVDAKAE